MTLSSRASFRTLARLANRVHAMASCWTRWGDLCESRAQLLRLVAFVSLVSLVIKVAITGRLTPCRELFTTAVLLILAICPRLRNNKLVVLCTAIAYHQLFVISCVAVAKLMLTSHTFWYTMEIERSDVKASLVPCTTRVLATPIALLMCFSQVGLPTFWVMLMSLTATLMSVFTLLTMDRYVNQNQITTQCSVVIWGLFPNILALYLVFDNQRLIWQMKSLAKAANTGATKQLESQQIAAENQRRIVGYIFHEVRNPINSVLLATELLLGLVPEIPITSRTDDLSPKVSAPQMSPVITFRSIANSEGNAASRTKQNTYAARCSNAAQTHCEESRRSPSISVPFLTADQRASSSESLPRRLPDSPQFLNIPNSVSLHRTNTCGSTSSNGNNNNNHTNNNPTKNNKAQPLNLGEQTNNTMLGEVRELVEDIHQSTQAAVRVLNDALNLQKLQSGAFEFVFRPFACKELVTATIRMVEPQMRCKRIRLRTAIDPQLEGVFVEGDFRRLQQVLLNYLSNAFKYTPPGGVVEVRMRCTGVENPARSHASSSTQKCSIKATLAKMPPAWIVDDDDLENGAKISGQVCKAESIAVRVSVFNSGSSIRDEDRLKIFQPWAQIRSGKQQQAEGSGLGLALCKAFIETGHKGQVWFDSEEGEGTEFFFEVLLKLASEEDAQALVSPRGFCFQPAHAKQRPVTLTSNETVLEMARGLTSLTTADDPFLASLPTNVDDSDNQPQSQQKQEKQQQQQQQQQQHNVEHVAKTQQFASGPNQPDPNIASGESEVELVVRPPSPKLTQTNLQAHVMAPEKIMVCTLHSTTPTRNSTAQDLHLLSESRTSSPQSVSHDVENPLISGAVATLKGHSIDVLIVEDSAMTRRLLSRTLVALGFTNHQAVDGQDAVEKISTVGIGFYGVILMDKEMPRMDGFEATKRLREMGFTNPILGCTGNVMEDQVQAFLAVGANDVIGKPVSQDGLATTLQTFGLVV